MNIRAVVFDMDGTLLDTLDDIADSANRVLAARGYPIHDREAYRQFVGDGSAVLMTRALPPDQRSAENVQVALEAFLENYGRGWHQATRPYPGILNLLKRLQKRKIGLAVVTNKHQRFTGIMMDHYFGDIPFHPILGHVQGVAKKPHPRQALDAAAILRVSPDTCVFLGDSAVDMETAKRAGMIPIGAAWGFRTRRELREAGAAAIIDHPLEMMNLIDSDAAVFESKTVGRE
jgi:phosphoglycolate phosphatase